MTKANYNGPIQCRLGLLTSPYSKEKRVVSMYYFDGKQNLLSPSLLPHPSVGAKYFFVCLL